MQDWVFALIALVAAGLGLLALYWVTRICIYLVKLALVVGLLYFITQNYTPWNEISSYQSLSALNIAREQFTAVAVDLFEFARGALAKRT